MIVDFRSVPHVPSTEARNFPPLEFEFASGNSCTVTPSISEDPCYPGQQIVVFAYCWKNKPDQEDVSEIETLMTRLVFALRHQKKS